MATRKPDPPARVSLIWDGGAVAYRAQRAVRRWRYLLDDGRTVDVLDDHADSDTATAVLAVTGAARIVGATPVPEDEDEGDG